MGAPRSLQEENPTVAATEQVRLQGERKIAEQKQQATAEELDQRLVQLEEQMFKFAEQYGIEDFRTQLMIQFHEVALVMRDSIEVLRGVTNGMSYIFQTIEFIDEMMDYQTSMMTGSLEHKYGALARMRERRRIRRTVKNIRNRMAMFTNRICAVQGMSQVIVEALVKATGKMQAKTAKNKARFQKRNPSIDPQDSKSMQMVRDHLAARGGGDSAAAPAPDTTTAGGGGGIAPTGGGSTGGGSTGGADDMSDIL